MNRRTEFSAYALIFVAGCLITLWSFGVAANAADQILDSPDSAVTLQHQAAGWLNLGVGVVTSVLVVAALRYLTGGKETIGELSSPTVEEAPWRDPLKTAVRQIIENGQITESSSLSLFAQRLPNGQDLLTTLDIRELRQVLRSIQERQ